MSDLPEVDFAMKSEISSGLTRTRELLASNVMWGDSSLFYRKSVLIEILIYMKDLLIKADKLGNRISFDDDVFPDPNPRIKIKDVTDLISNFRDAACHIDSFRRNYGSLIFSFNEARGKKILFKMNDVNIGCAYEDDIAFNMGVNVLYLKRHIERAFLEVETFLVPLVSDNRQL